MAKHEGAVVCATEEGLDVNALVERPFLEYQFAFDLCAVRLHPTGGELAGSFVHLK